MDNKKLGWIAGSILVLIVIAIAITAYFSYQNTNPVVTKPINNAGVTSTDDLIHVTAPLANVFVQSPLIVKGEARGNWYFEASFPVKIFDSTGKQLGVVVAQAQGDWITTNFVPFQATLNFEKPTTETGTVVFIKDNPSGLAANDASVVIPVYFSANASKQ